MVQCGGWKRALAFLLAVHAVLTVATDAANALKAARSSGGLVRGRARKPPLRGGGDGGGQGDCADGQVASSFSSTSGRGTSSSSSGVHLDSSGDAWQLPGQVYTYCLV